jgi:hypothetical protein
MPLKRREYISGFSCWHLKYSTYTFIRWFIAVWAIETAAITIETDVWGVLATLFDVPLDSLITSILVRLCIILSGSLDSGKPSDLESGQGIGSETTRDCGGGL